MGRWIIYPQTKFVKEETLRLWLNDDIANGKCEAMDVSKLTLDEVCSFLSDSGTVTFADHKADEQQLRVIASSERMEELMDRE